MLITITLMSIIIITNYFGGLFNVHLWKHWFIIMIDNNYKLFINYYFNFKSFLNIFKFFIQNGL